MGAKVHPSRLVRLGSHVFRLSLVERGKLTEEKGKAAPEKQKRRRKAKARKAPRKAARRTRRK